MLDRVGWHGLMKPAGESRFAARGERINMVDRVSTASSEVQERTGPMRQARNPRRAYDRDGRELEPMTLANLRRHGVRSVDAACEACGHEASVNVDAFPDAAYVPDVALRLRCSSCGSRRINTRPDWREMNAPGMMR